MDDECFGVNSNGAKARCRHHEDEQDDDEDNAPDIWWAAAFRRRTIVIGVGVQEVHHLGRRRMRAVSEVGNECTVGSMNPALSATDGEKGAAEEGRSWVRQGGDEFIVRQGPQAMDLVAKLGRATFSTSAGSLRRSFRDSMRYLLI